MVLDENHGTTPELLRELNALGVCYKTLNECGISPGTEDVPILRAVGKRGWILVTTDKAIRRNALEYAVAVEFSVGQFVFSNNNMNGPEIAHAFRLAFNDIVDIATREKRPFVASIGKTGTVKLLFNASGRVLS